MRPDLVNPVCRPYQGAIVFSFGHSLCGPGGGLCLSMQRSKTWKQGNNEQQTDRPSLLENVASLMITKRTQLATLASKYREESRKAHKFWMPCLKSLGHGMTPCTLSQPIQNVFEEPQVEGKGTSCQIKQYVEVRVCTRFWALEFLCLKGDPRTQDREDLCSLLLIYKITLQVW